MRLQSDVDAFAAIEEDARGVGLPGKRGQTTL